LVTLSISAKAQFSLGVKGGVNFSKINTDNLNNSTLTGYQAGLFARFGTGLYLQPELYLSGTGGKFNSDDNTYSAKVRFTNLNVPLLIGETFGAKNLNFRIMAGPVYTSVLSKSFSESVNDAYTDFGHYKTAPLDTRQVWVWI
jgi:hypothetical protein